MQRRAGQRAFGHAARRKGCLRLGAHAVERGEIDRAQAEHHGRGLQALALVEAEEGRAGARHQVEIARCVDEQPRPDLEHAALGEHGRRADSAAAPRHLGELAVQQDAHAGLVRHLVQHHLQDLGVVLDPVHAVARRHDEMPVAAAAAHGLEALDDLLGNAGDDAPAGPRFPADELADRARRRRAAQEAVALEQHGARALSRRGDGGHGACHAAAARQDVAVDGIHAGNRPYSGPRKNGRHSCFSIV